MEKVSFLGFDNCYKIFNDSAEIIVTTDVGPRVMFYGRPGGTNQLGVFLEPAQETDFGIWKPYGGHRLWAAPEGLPFSYAPDNDPLETRIEGDFSIRLMQKVDAAGIEKEMTVSLDPSSSATTVHHKLTNRRSEALEIAVWVLTVFDGGDAYVPLAAYKSHDDALLPSQALILWPFTELTDPRINLGKGWIHVTCDSRLSEPQKLGLANQAGWAAHYGGEELFIKRFNYLPGVSYPDFGANTELYVAANYMEIETLGPLTRLQPGESIEHTEQWDLMTVSPTGLKAALENLHPKNSLKVSHVAILE